MRYTEKQQQAFDLENGKLVLAGAGSGKTTVLTERYLLLLEQGKAIPSEIVAVTFTRKAAGQLFSRIYEKILAKEKSDCDRQPFWRQCREDLVHANISTLHGYFTSILKSFPLESKVDPDFNAGMESRLFIEQKIRTCIRKLAYENHPDLEKALEGFDSIEKLESTCCALFEKKEVLWALLDATRNENIKEATAYLDTLLNDTLTDEIEDLVRQDDKLKKKSPGSHADFLKNLQSLAVILRTLQEQIGEHARMLSYDDLEALTLRLFKQHPEVLRQVAHSIRYLLVDEFQDTSSLQWALIRMLCSDEEGRFIPEKAFFVGDAKQSIYGFRNANVTVVNEAEKVFQSAYERSGKEEKWSVNLNDNFRSLPELVNPLNCVFDRMLQPMDDDFHRFEAKPQPLTSRRESLKGLQPCLDLAIGDGKKPDNLFKFVARRIRDAVAEGFPVTDRENPETPLRRLEYRDICILLRSRTHLSQLISTLRSLGIPFQTSGGTGFAEQQEILDCLHLVASLVDSRDKMAFLGLLRSPFFHFSDPSIAALFLKKGEIETVWESLASGGGQGAVTDEDLQVIRDGWEFWSSLKTMSKVVPFPQLLLHALETSGALAAYAAGPLGRQRVANIHKFIGLIREHAGLGGYTLRRLKIRMEELLRVLALENEEMAAVDNPDGVSILTIHKAKGLQFPYVILTDVSDSAIKKNRTGGLPGNLNFPDDDWKPLTSSIFNDVVKNSIPDNKYLVHDLMYHVLAKREEIAENKRLLYVALTRASDRLLIAVNTPKKKNLSLLSLLLEAFDFKKDESGFYTPGDSFPAGVNLLMIPAADEPGTDLLNDTDLISSENTSNRSVNAPTVHFARPPSPGRLELPITGFAEYLAHPTLANRQKLLSFGSDELLEKKEDDTSSLNSSEEATNVEFSGVAGKHREIGTFVHGLLYGYGLEINWERVRSKVEAFTDTLFTYPETREKAITLIRKLLFNAGTLPIPREGNRYHSELPLLMKLNDHVTLRGRMDLVWQEGDSWIVGDYKTNLADKSALPDVIENHGYHHQVKLYSLGLLQAWNPPKVEGRLFFLFPGEVRTIPVDPQEINFYRQQMDELIA